MLKITSLVKNIEHLRARAILLIMLGSSQDI